MISWSSRKKKEGIFCNVYFGQRNFFYCFISIYSILNILSEYKWFYLSKNITSYTFLLVLKIVERLQCILKLVRSDLLVKFANLIGWLNLLVIGVKKFLQRVNLMYQPPKCPHSYFSKGLEFYLRVLLPCEYL